MISDKFELCYSPVMFPSKTRGTKSTAQGESLVVIVTVKVDAENIGYDFAYN